MNVPYEKKNVTNDNPIMFPYVSPYPNRSQRRSRGKMPRVMNNKKSFKLTVVGTDKYRIRQQHAVLSTKDSQIKDVKILHYDLKGTNY